MKLIPLTRGFTTKVDDADYVWLTRWKWHVTSRSGYAARNKSVIADGRRGLIYMHKEILGIESAQGDHKNGDRLDNQRYNLRVAPFGMNQWNMKPHKDSKSGLKGITETPSGTWCVRLSVKRRIVFRRNFKDKTTAILAYNEAALQHHGEFAKLNEVPNGVS